MQNRLAAVLALPLLWTVDARAQPASPAPTPSPSASPSPIPSFNEVRTPTSPAFTVLGIAPSEVERPATPAGVAFTVLNQTNNLSSLPKDVALELSPYWLASHPLLTWQDDADRTFGESILRTLSVSVATAQTGSTELPVTSLGFGGRAALFSGHLSPRARASLQALSDLLAAEAGIYAEFRDRFLAARRNELTAALAARLARATTEAERTQAAAQFAVDFEAAKKEAREKVEASEEYKAAVQEIEEQATPISGDRQGLIVELAGAGAWDFPGGGWDGRTLRQWGVWLTPSYVGDSWSAVGVARYLKKGFPEDGKSVDLGARLVYYKKRYAVSAEYLRQFGSDGVEDGDRFAALFDYEVLSGTWATVSVGQGLTPEGAKTVIAQIGLAFNFSEKRYTLKPGH